MSTLKISYYRMFCMVLALLILDKKTKLTQPTNERINHLFRSHNDSGRLP